MKHDRLHALSDGIFAIAMTILVFDIHVPILKVVTNATLWHSLRELAPVFLSFVLTYAVLFTYWRSHNFIITNLAKNLDTRLTNYNAIFLFFVVILPFSAEFLGMYHNNELGIVLYGLNVIALSSTSIFMRNYIVNTEHIENSDWTDREYLNGYIRMAVPSVFAVIAILIGFYSTRLSLLLFTLAILFNFSTSSATIVRILIGKR